MGPAPISSATTQVDAAPILDKAVKTAGQSLTSKRPIEDLLKALMIDSSSRPARNWAHELGYTGSTDDSATMSFWLHKTVVKSLSENVGEVPVSLLDPPEKQARPNERRPA